MEKTNIFDAEWNDILESLKERNHSFKEMDYFIKLAKQRMQDIALLKSRSEIILLGFDFPEEIVRAFGKAPCYLLGGSFTSAQKAEDMVPRDTDSAIKSIMGMLDIKKEQTKDTSLILLPIVSDSMRKVAGLLKEKCKIIPFEVPNDKTDTLQRIRFTDEIFRVTGEIEKYLHRPLSGKKLS